ncbi:MULTISPECIES: hypothetical protein [unclassified Burkholderia]|uniref:hypothetical protein n=1 Tax=unclassified Burkholderia TaxID=2613784 RepID=UPI00162A8F9B|nr:MULTISPECIES: hypothetical protein [unclassified Burkholderia]
MNNTTDPALKAQYLREAKDWAEGGDNRVALHIVAGALTAGLTAGGLGSAGDAAGAGLSAKLAEDARSSKDAGPTGNANVDEDSEPWRRVPCEICWWREINEKARYFPRAWLPRPGTFACRLWAACIFYL